MSIVTASFEFSGFSDYWGGNGRRWDDNAGCVFSYYGARTTLREIIDGAVDDFNAGGDCDSFPEEVDGEMVREALLECLTSQGFADYESGALSEWAEEYASNNDLDVCRECGAHVGEPHNDDCSFLAEWREDGDCEEDEIPLVEESDCADGDEFHESPVVIFLLECSVCSVCGKAAEYAIDDICAECHEEEGKWHIGDDVSINDYGDAPVWGKIVKLSDTSAIIEIAGKKIRREYGDFSN